MAPFALWIASGMESGLTAMLVMAAAYVSVAMHGRRRLWGVGLVSALLLLDRPDGVTVLAAAVVDLLAGWIREERRSSRQLLTHVVCLCLPTAAIYLPYFIWRASYFGYLFPNTYYAKVSGVPVVSRALAGLLDTSTFVVYWAAVPVFLFAIYAILPGRRARPLRFAYLVVVLRTLYVIYIGGDVLGWSRFFVPMIPLLAVFSTVALGQIAQAFALGETQTLWAAVALVGVMSAVSYGSMQFTKLTFPGSFDVQSKAAALRREQPCALCQWLIDHAPPGSSIALYAAGAVPYFTDFLTIDRIGLNDTYIAHNGLRVLGGRHPEYKIALDYWLPMRPTFIISRLDNSDFLRGVVRPVHPALYEEDVILTTRQEFLDNYVVLEGGQPTNYALFQLRETVDPACLENRRGVPIPVCVMHERV
jgi:hypothetical protein